MEIKTSFAGSNVWWTSDEVALGPLKHQLSLVGYSNIVIEPKSDKAALRAVVEGQWSRAHRRLIRPVTNGYTIVREKEQSGIAGVDDPLDFDCIMSIRLQREDLIRGPMRVVLSGKEYDRLPEEAQETILANLNRLFQEEKKKVGREQLTRILVRILKTDFQALQLQKNGSFYWINAKHVSAWDNIVRAVEVAWKESGSQRGILMKQNVNVDDDAIRAVAVSLREDIFRNVELIENEVTKGEAGKRRLKTLTNQAKDLHSRINEYRSLLGPALDELHESASRAAKTATLAALRGNMS